MHDTHLCQIVVKMTNSYHKNVLVFFVLVTVMMYFGFQTDLDLGKEIDRLNSMLSCDSGDEDADGVVPGSAPVVVRKAPSVVKLTQEASIGKSIYHCEICLHYAKSIIGSSIDVEFPLSVFN